MQDLLKVFDSEKTLKLLNNKYCNFKKLSNEEKNAILSIDNVKYYYYAGKNDEDVRKLYSFLKQIQDNAICIAEANKRVTNRDELVDEDDLDEFDEIGYIEYKCFQVFLLKYNDKYYVLSKPFLMQKEDDVLMLQITSDPIEAKLEFHKVLDRLQKEYNISLLKDTDIL